MSKEISRDQINLFRTDLIDQTLDNIEMLEEIIEGRLDRIRDELDDKLSQFGEVENTDRWILTLKKGIYEAFIYIFSEAGFDLKLDIKIYNTIDYIDIKRVVINLPIKVAKNGGAYLDSDDALEIAKKIITTIDSCDNLN